MSDDSTAAQCCVLEICCGANAAVAALTTQVMKAHRCSPAEAKRHATWFAKSFDLAPKGTLGPFKKAIAAAVKAHK